MSKLEWLDGNRIGVDPPSRPKKITGTRLGAILGVNRWKTPFAAWCEMTRTYEEPFTDTIYTKAGKIIEPKQARFAKIICGFPGFVTPEDKYGKNYFKDTYGDFFHENPVFGGMWDYLSYENKKKNSDITVLEMKTTKRKQDWEKDIPEYYALQAALYAYLLNTDKVCMVVSYLKSTDYDHPDKFLPTKRNTQIFPFRLSERYPNFENDYIKPALDFWNNYVLTGYSPPYDEKKDADILAELRKKVIDVGQTTEDELISEAEHLQAELDKYSAITKPIEDRMKILKDAMRTEALDMLDSGTDKVVYAGASYGFTVSKVTTSKVDTEALKADGLYEKYVVPSISYKITIKRVKEND